MYSSYRFAEDESNTARNTPAPLKGCRRATPVVRPLPPIARDPRWSFSVYRPSSLPPLRQLQVRPQGLHLVEHPDQDGVTAVDRMKGRLRRRVQRMVRELFGA